MISINRSVISECAGRIEGSRIVHTGVDLNIPVPWWGFLDMNGHVIERVQDYWVKVGYTNAPVNMLSLNRDQLARLIYDRSLRWNRQHQPSLPIAVLPRSYAPLSCKPPMCNPHQSIVGFGLIAVEERALRVECLHHGIVVEVAKLRHRPLRREKSLPQQRCRLNFLQASNWSRANHPCAAREVFSSLQNFLKKSQPQQQLVNRGQP
ncbi:hypothetical protein RB195_021077 [Necator americanus]|uniref:Uncharacterized protein n=1 Tax=Necator americanus TaxID=51031 RepID=A0ABR1E9H8_NECAM